MELGSRAVTCTLHQRSNVFSLVMIMFIIEKHDVWFNSINVGTAGPRLVGTAPSRATIPEFPFFHVAITAGYDHSFLLLLAAESKLSDALTSCGYRIQFYIYFINHNNNLHISLSTGVNMRSQECPYTRINITNKLMLF